MSHDRSQLEESIVQYAFDATNDNTADLAWKIARDEELLTYVCRLIEDSAILAAAAAGDIDDLPQCAQRL